MVNKYLTLKEIKRLIPHREPMLLIDKVKVIKLKNGGAVEDYGDLIDAYEKGIDVMEGESLTDYINRIRAAEKNK